MIYRCPNPNCFGNDSTYQEEVARSLKLKCPLCKVELQVEKKLTSEFQDKVIREYPHLIASPFLEMMNKKDVDGKKKAFTDLLTAILKYLALVVETEYLRSDFQDDKLNRFIEKRLMISINVSSWRDFLCEAIPAMEKAEHSFFCRDLPGFFREIEEFEGNTLPKPEKHSPFDKGYWDEDGEFRKTSQEMAPLTTLIHFRNKIAHAPIRTDEHEAEQDFFFHYDIMENLLRKMKWCLGYPMHKRENERITSLMGAALKQHDKEYPELVSQENVEGIFLQRQDGENEDFPLLPFFVDPGEFLSADEIKSNEHLLAFDANTGKRIQYYSPIGSHHELEAPFKDLDKMLKSKKSFWEVLKKEDIEHAEISSRCLDLTKQTREQLSDSGKVLKGLYYPRKEIESQIYDWLKTPFPVAVISASAGSGKTCLLDHLASDLAEMGSTTLFLRAREMKQKEVFEEVRHLLCLDADVCAKDLAEHGTKTNEPFVVIVDGINEHLEPCAILKSVISLVKHSSNKLKVLLSYRSDQDDLLFIDQQDRRLFYVEATGSNALPEVSLEPNQSHKPPALGLAPLNRVEMKECWEQYAEYSPQGKRIHKPGFSFDKAWNASRDTMELLGNPMQLRIFMETFHGTNIPKSISRQELFTRYFKHLAKYTKDQGEFLLNLGRICLDQRQNKIGSEILYSDDRTAPEMRETYRAKPFNKLLKRNVIHQSALGHETIMVSFTAEAFLEYVLGKVLIEDDLADTPEKLSEMFSLRESFTLLQGACEHALLHQVMKMENPTFLDNFIKQTNDSENITGGVLGQMLLQEKNFEELVAKFMANPTEKHLNAAICAVEFLRKELPEEPSMVDNFLTEVLKKAEHLNSSESLGKAYRHLGQTKYSLEEFDECESYTQHALGIFRETQITSERSPKVIWEILNCLHNLFELNRTIGRIDNAKICLDESEELLLRLGTKRQIPLWYYRFYHSTGLLHYKMHKYKEAIGFLEKARGLYCDEKIRGLIDLEWIIWTLSNLALAYGEDGQRDNQLECQEESFRILTENYGKEYPRLATSLINRGLALYHNRQFDRALEDLEQAERILSERKHFARDNAECFNALGIVFAAKGNFPKAIDYYLKAWRVVQKYPEKLEGHLFVNLGEAYQENGQSEEAIQLFKDGKKYYEQKFGSLDLDLAWCCDKFGDTYIKQKNYPKAIQELQQALAIYEKSDPGSEVIPTIHHRLAESYAKDRNIAKAASHSHMASKAMQGNELAFCYLMIGSELIENGAYNLAEEYFLKAKRLLQNLEEPNHNFIKAVGHNLSELRKIVSNENFSDKKIKKVGRNAPCPCGSGKKYKKCCGQGSR